MPNIGFKGVKVERFNEAFRALLEVCYGVDARTKRISKMHTSFSAYLLDVFLLTPEVSDCHSSLTNLDIFALLCL